MFGRSPESIDLRNPGAEIDTVLDTLPDLPGVFVVFAREGRPYLSRTSSLRRRLKRLLGSRDSGSRLLTLRPVAERIQWWPTGSGLESQLVLYEAATTHAGSDWIRYLKLRMPAYVKLIHADPFPRTQVTTKLAGAAGQYYGPFRTRAGAEQFEHEALNLFQLRRCQEDLQPGPEHPGCIYGEMSMCLRPCQQVVGSAEYRSEADRVSEFLSSSGRTFLQTARSVRERFCEELAFEEAARQHKRVERIEQVLKLRDELVCDIDSLHGIAITACAAAACVTLWPMSHGCWQAPIDFPVAQDDHSVSLDRRLRDCISGLGVSPPDLRSRQEHLALLARWYYSTWRDGEWVPFERFEKIPYRKLVHAISRVSQRSGWDRPPDLSANSTT
jgi:excinuclease UvrABC nuclease subunit